METNTVYQILGAVSLIYFIAKWTSPSIKLPEGTPVKKPLPIFGNFWPIFMQKIGFFGMIDQLYYEFRNKK
jgi:hypothetical protein